MRIIWFAFFAPVLMSQTVPAVGWVSTGQHLRRLVGLPGSTRAESPMASFDNIRIAPGGQLALVEDRAGAALMSLTDDGPVPLVRLDSIPDAAAFAEDGSALALLFGTRLEVRSCVLGRVDRLWSAEAEEVSELTVASGGSMAAIRVTGGAIRLVTDAGIGPVLYQGMQLGPLRFRGSTALIFSDRTTGQLISIESITARPSTRVLRNQPADDYAVSTDGRRVFLLVRGDAGTTISVLDLEVGQIVQDFAAGVEAARLHRLAARDLFLLAEPTDSEPGWMLNGNEGQLTFLPALKIKEEN